MLGRLPPQNRIVAWFATILAAATALAGTSADLSDSRYRIDRWTAEKGLPQNQVRALLQTRDGYIWIGTLNGLARFDGVRFKVFDHSNTPEMTHESINALAEDEKDGSLWIGTGDGLLHYKDHRFNRFSTTKSIQEVVGFLCAARDGGVWYSPFPGFLNLVQKDELTACQFTDNSPEHAVDQIVELNPGSLLVNVRGNVFRLDWQSRSVVQFSSPIAGMNGACRSIFHDGDGTLWLSTFTDIWHLEGTNWAKAATALTLARTSPVTLYHRRNAKPYVTRLVGSHTSLHALTDDRLEPFPALADFDVVSFLEDREGNLWVGTTTGLLRLAPKRLEVYSGLNGLRNDDIQSTLCAHDGTIWLGTALGVSLIRGGEAVNLPPTSGDWSGPSARTGVLMEDRSGRLWLGDGSGQLVIANPRPGTDQTSFRNLRELGGAQYVFVDSKAQTWIATRKGVFCETQGQTNYFSKTNGLSFEDIRVVHEDRRGDIWFGTYGGGLIRFHQGQFSTHQTDHGENNNRCWWIHEDKDGTFWVASQEGLNRFRPPGLESDKAKPGAAHEPEFFTFTKQHGLYENIINNVQEDDFGNLWLSGLAGVYRVSRQELNEVAAGKRGQVGCLALGEAEGMLSSECNGGDNQPAGCKDPEGKIWFPTTKGVVVIDPKLMNRKEPPPPVVIEEVRASDEVIYGDVPRGRENHKGKGSTQPPSAANPLRVAPGLGRVLEIHYTANTFGQPDRVHFKFRLDGYDADWHADDSNRRVAFYTNLRPGEYTFRVTGCNASGLWNEEGAQLAFFLAPHFYQTSLFYFLCGATMLLSASALHYSRVRRINRLRSLEQQHALDLERARIARDIHDDLGSRFLQISVLGELTSRNIEANGEAGQHLEKLRGTANEAFQALDEIVWAANPTQDSLEGLVSYLREFVPQFTAPVGIQCRLEFPSPVPSLRLGTQARHHLFMVVKEALQNVIKHAQATEVTLRLVDERGHLHITIKDNGRGLNSLGPTANGNGLTNMRHRLAELGGTFAVRSAPGQGTEITCEITV